eukprot:jgi/Mesvir1/27382/Mv07187-RA.2
MTSTLVNPPMAVLTKKRHVNIPNYGTTSDSGPSLFYERTFLSQVPASEESARQYYEQLAEKHAEMKRTRAISARRHIFTLADEGRDLLMADKKGANLFTPKQRHMASLLMHKMGDPWQDKLTLADVERFLRHAGISFPPLTLAGMFKEAQLYADGTPRPNDGNTRPATTVASARPATTMESTRINTGGGGVGVADASPSTSSPHGAAEGACLTLGELEVAVSGCVQGRKHNYDWQLLAELAQSKGGPSKPKPRGWGATGRGAAQPISDDGALSMGGAGTGMHPMRGDQTQSMGGVASQPRGAKAGNVAIGTWNKPEGSMRSNHGMDPVKDVPGSRAAWDGSHSSATPFGSAAVERSGEGHGKAPRGMPQNPPSGSASTHVGGNASTGAHLGGNASTQLVSAMAGMSVGRNFMDAPAGVYSATLRHGGVLPSGPSHGRHHGGPDGHHRHHGHNTPNWDHPHNNANGDHHDNNNNNSSSNPNPHGDHAAHHGLSHHHQQSHHQSGHDSSGKHKTSVAERRQAWAVQSSALHAPGPDRDPCGGGGGRRRSWDSDRGDEASAWHAQMEAAWADVGGKWKNQKQDGGVERASEARGEEEVEGAWGAGEASLTAHPALAAVTLEGKVGRRKA